MLQPSGSSNQTRSMKPSLQLQIGQQLTMTPQLQQAIRLLQLSTLDLRLEIQQAVESFKNPPDGSKPYAARHVGLQRRGHLCEPHVERVELARAAADGRARHDARDAKDALP